MEHIKIIQGTNLADTEDVSMQVIQKLYNIASGSTLDNTSDLQGRLHATIAYREPVEWLTTHYPNLHISVDSFAIPFEDPNMLAYLNSIGVGSNGMVTEAQAAAATVVANSENTTVRKFNELKYFTGITESAGGWDVPGNGKIRFNGWTALEEIDISNFTSIGHGGTFAVSDSFYGCTALKKVTASNKLVKFGRCVFQNCSNLEDIIGLSGTIMLENAVFNGCTKLKGASFDNCTISFYSTFGESAFKQCKAITNITIDNSITKIPKEAFYQCSALASINLGNITEIALDGFRETALTSADLSNIITIGERAFYGCNTLVSVTMPNSAVTIA